MAVFAELNTGQFLLDMGKETKKGVQAVQPRM